MCGFAGYFGEALNLSADHPYELLNVLNHRGPDGNGLFEEENYLVAHCRLSVLDLSSNAAQPMISGNGRFVLAYNGEIYNYREIQKELDVSWKSHSDTEVLLEALVRWKMQALEKLNGMFAFALFDREKKELFLVRDRFGIKPLYYHWDGKILAFASELKAIKKMVSDLKINREALADFLFLEYIPGKQTIYENVHSLEAGTFVRIDREFNLNNSRYYELSDKKMSIDRQKNTPLELEQLLLSSINYRKISDVPMGAFLSGGSDSSLICALYQLSAKQPVETFSMGFDVREYDESQYAKSVSEHLRTNHHNFQMTEYTAGDFIETMVGTYDQPFAVPSVIPMLYLSSNCRQWVTVALSGDGGDEIFMGYGHYRWWKRLNTLRRIGGPGLSPFIAKLLKKFGSRYRRVSSLMDHTGIPAFWPHVWSQEQYMFTEQQISNLTGRKYGHETLVKSWEKISNSGLTDFEKISLFDLCNYLPNDLLYKVDMASMAYGLEVRLPFLDHRVVEYALSMPDHLKISGRHQKAIEKQILSKYLPKHLVYRKKWGFPAPMDHWLKKDFAHLIDDYLGRDKLLKSNFFVPEEVERLIGQFRSGEDFQFKRLWALINFQMWYFHNY